MRLASLGDVLTSHDNNMSGPQPEESPKQRVDRELSELLDEVRVVLPGVELLLGFLLILPFSNEFQDLDLVRRGVYLGCMTVAAAATALLMAPTAWHRLGFRSVDKERLVLLANRLIIGALVLVAIAIALAVYLVSWVVLESTWPAAVTAGIACWFCAWWFVAPYLLHRQ
jgi:hypothetical protein